VNNNFSRPNQHKNNNNRNRNRNNNRRNTGSGGSGGGTGNNKVFDSNGPDIKLRGTTQTIAEKYMQLGRDAQSSGDGVAAENYYQHAEHYYRLWAANQPVGHSLQMSRKLGEDEFEDEGDDQAGGEDDSDGNSNSQATDNAPVEGAAVGDGDSNVAPGESQQQRQNRSPNPRDNNNRDQNGRNFRPRWQNNRNNRNYENRDGQPVADQNGAGPVEGGAEVVQSQPATQVVEHDGQWEAPSFLQRPAPAISDEAPIAQDAEPVARKPRTRRPRVEAPVDDSSKAAE
jgi:Domain of unknown function (DUF4167)